jgi:Arc/MetJ family transcription regulator
MVLSLDVRTRQYTSIVVSLHIGGARPMRTNIDIDDKLMRKAMKATGASSKKGAVEAAMKLAVQLHGQGESVQKLWGLAVWRGHDDDWFAPDEEILARNRAVTEDLNASRADRSGEHARKAKVG